MQQIILSGTLIADATEHIDKNGRKHCRFILTCGETDVYGRTVYIHYNCICYKNGYEGMKKGDQVFITGKFLPSLNLDKDGKAYMNLNVMINTISGGYRANERKKTI